MNESNEGVIIHCVTLASKHMYIYLKGVRLDKNIYRLMESLSVSVSVICCTSLMELSHIYIIVNPYNGFQP